MTSETNLLSIIRAASMPIHKKLDNVGISKAMKEGSFTKMHYLHWLVSTYQFMAGFRLLEDRSEKYNDSFSSFSPSSLGISQLENDIKIIDPDISLPDPLALPIADHPDLAAIPIYTLLGSLMGTEIIYKHVVKIDQNLPITYLEHILQNKSNWKKFKAFINNYKHTASEPQISEYTTKFWNVIYDSH